MSRAERFYKMCVDLPYEEVKDSRDENSIPELVTVAEMRDAGNMQDAVDYASALMKMYPDNDLIPFMVAYIYYQKDFPEEAIRVALEAIPRCPRKYRLYSVLGLAEFSRGRLPEALVWWARSVVAQCMVSDYQEPDPFLHLAHAAEAVGAKREARMLFSVSDAIEPDAPRLDDESLEKMRALKKSWVRDPLIRVLKYIDRNYLHG
ncbi:MAG TPA: hypothetical protein ENI95_08400 [Chloroflexi bacterium]|nr:hypothetical protein [Chloroflexota bacterium]